MNEKKTMPPKRAKFAVVDGVQYNWNLDIISLEDTLPLLMEAASKGLSQSEIINYVNTQREGALVIAGAGRGKTAIPLSVRIEWVREYLQLLERANNGDNDAKVELQNNFGRVIIAPNGQALSDSWQSLITKYEKPFESRLQAAKLRKAAKLQNKSNESVD